MAAAPSAPSAPSGRRTRGLLALAWVTALALLALVHGASLRAHIAAAADPLIFSDDARQQIWPFLRAHDPGLFRDDYVADYYLSAIPPGYRLLMGGLARVADPRAVAKVLPYVLLALTLAALAAAAHRLAGPGAAWATLALALSSGAYLLQVTGGLPRAFGFPLVAAAAAALAHGRPLALAAVACLGAALYPSAGAIAGLALAALLLLPGGMRGAAAGWSLRRRLAALAATGAVILTIALPTALALRPFGPMLRPAQVAQYPEIGPGGRYWRGDVMPSWELAPRVTEQTRVALVGAGAAPSVRVRALAGRILTPAAAAVSLLLLAGLGVAAGLAGSAAGRRTMALPAAMLAGFALSNLVAPYLYLSDRYVRYAWPVFLHVALPAGLVWLAARALPRRAPRALAPTLALAAVAAYLLLAGGRGSPDAGLTVRIPPEHAAFYRFAATLPPDARLAGWPALADAGAVVENVPYLSARRVLLSAEVHVVFNEGYALEMRRRMRALIDAYFATDAAPLHTLRARFSVTHLVIDRGHYSAAPTYFRPFDQWTAQAFAAGRAAGFEAPRRITEAGVFDDGTRVVLDLSRLR